MYGGAEFRAVVDAVLDVTDKLGTTLSDAELDRMREHHRTTSRYEWMFWDAGYRRETWPV
jgi:thiaminase/transcriptional activator TenA